MILIFLTAFISLSFSVNSYAGAFDVSSSSCRKQAIRKPSTLFPALITRMPALCAKAEVEQDGIFRRKNLPVFGVAIGLTALFFQVFILYPWHEVLRDDFSTLEVKIQHPLLRKLGWISNKILTCEMVLSNRS